MEAELAIAALLVQIEDTAGFQYTPDRRDQREPSDIATYVTSQVISSDSNTHLTGEADLDHTRVQLNIFSVTKRDGILVRRRIRQHLTGFRGEVSVSDYPDDHDDPAEIGRVFVSDCLPAGGRTLYQPPSDGSEAGDYVVACDFILSVTSGI